MRAVVQEQYGGTETLEVRDIPEPRPGKGEVLVRVHAAGVDRGTWHLMAGLPYPVRLAFGLRRPKYPTPGRALAGVVTALGEGATRFAVGDQVYGAGSGSFAEVARAPEARLAPKPAGLSFEQAAAVPISGHTALQALRDAGRIQAGQRVLVIGASGGVGTYAVQLAAAYGAEVTAVCSTGKIDLMRSLGVRRILDYTRGDIVETAVERYDLVVDLAGNRPLRRLRRLLTPAGTLVLAGGEDGGAWLGGMQRQLAAAALSPFVRQRLTSLLSTEKATDLEVLTGFLESGAIRPALDRTFTLDEAAKAIDHLEAGHARGKVVIAVTAAS
jgi:NADPH:quinone reductase-like Zn-dependent oxidoreductase